MNGDSEELVQEDSQGHEAEGLDAEVEEHDEEEEVPSIPVGVDLLADIDGIGERMPCRLVGADEGEFLLATTPGEGMRDQYYIGREFLGRFASEGKICGFRAKVQQAVSSPVRVLFLSYPDSLEEIALAPGQSVSPGLPAVILSNGSRLVGLVSQLTREGARFAPSDEQESSLECPASVEVGILLPGSEQAVRFPAEASNGLEGEAIAVSFQSLEADAQQALDEYLSSQANQG